MTLESPACVSNLGSLSGEEWALCSPESRTSLLPPAVTLNRSPPTSISCVEWPCESCKYRLNFCFSRASFLNSFSSRVLAMALVRAWTSLSYIELLINWKCRSRFATHPDDDAVAARDSVEEPCCTIGAAEPGLAAAWASSACIGGGGRRSAEDWFQASPVLATPAN